MYIFKFRWCCYISYLIPILLTIVLILLFRDWFYTALFLIGIIVVIIGFIEDVTNRIIFDNTMIQEKSLFIKKSINLNDIEKVILLPNSKGKKILIGINSQDNCIIVTSWYRNYKLLLRLIVEYCKTKETIKIDPKVLDIIN